VIASVEVASPFDPVATKIPFAKNTRCGEVTADVAPVKDKPAGNFSAVAIE
jgi:hypothetical protein